MGTVDCSCELEKDVQKKYSLDSVAKVAEVVASVGVIASLVWVAIELHLNTEETRHANAFAVTSFAVENRLRSLESGVSAVLAKSSAGSDLTAREAQDLRYYFQYQFQEFELVHYQFTEGRLDEQIMAAWEARLRATLSSAIGNDQWRRTRHLYSERFRNYAKRLRSPDATDPEPPAGPLAEDDQASRYPGRGRASQVAE